jgi:hypothetical protein
VVGVPYKAAESTLKQIRVMGISLKNMRVTPGPPWTAGQTVRLAVDVYEDTTPKAGYYVYFYVYAHYDDAQESYGPFASTSTGTVYWDFTIPWTLKGYTVPCSYMRFLAYDPATMVWSDQVIGDVAYPTTLTLTAPDSVGVGKPFTISGRLTYQASSDPTNQVGLGGRTITIYYDTNKLAEARTGTDGSYSVTVSIPTTGTYWLKATYAGEGYGAAAAAGPVALPVTGAVVLTRKITVSRTPLLRVPVAARRLI